jgi:hypothetical protein
MYNVGDDPDFDGFNWGEGGCRVGAKYYAAFTHTVGEDSGTRTAEHHVLLQFEDAADWGPDFQKWRRPNLEACGESAPVPDVPP